MKTKELNRILDNISMWYPINVLDEGKDSQRKYYAIFDLCNQWICKLELVISNKEHKIVIYAKVKNDQRSWKDCICPVILEEVFLYDFIAEFVEKPYRMEYEYYHIQDLMPYWIWRIKKFFNRDKY